jgi:hypothetical protein
MATTTPEIMEELQARRAELALAGQEGDEAAAPALEAVEAEIARRHRDAERAGLAEGARQERDAQVAARAEEERRKVLEARFAALEGERLEAARRVDAAADTLVEALKELTYVGEAMYRTRLELGENRPRLRLGETIAAAIPWRVAPYAPSVGRRSTGGDS